MYNVWVEFFIFDVKLCLLKKVVLGKVGGIIGCNNFNVVVIEVLCDIIMELNLGDWVGLVGYNGVGKLMLLCLFLGIYEFICGWVKVIGRVVLVFDLGIGMDFEIFGYENIIICGLFLG